MTEVSGIFGRKIILTLLRNFNDHKDFNFKKVISVCCEIIIYHAKWFSVSFLYRELFYPPFSRSRFVTGTTDKTSKIPMNLFVIFHLFVCHRCEKTRHMFWKGKTEMTYQEMSFWESRAVDKFWWNIKEPGYTCLECNAV